MGHVLTENCNGLIVDATLRLAAGLTENESTCLMFGQQDAGGHTTVVADKPETSQTSAVDCRSTRHTSYAIS